MSYAILSLALLALFHFIYESILAPSFRMKLHFELGALQDQLRCLQREGSVRVEHARYLDDSLSSLLCMLHRFDVAMLVAVGQEVRLPDVFGNQLHNQIHILREAR